MSFQGQDLYKKYLEQYSLSPTELSRNEFLLLAAIDDPGLMSMAAPLISEYGPKALGHIMGYWNGTDKHNLSSLWDYVKN